MTSDDRAAVPGVVAEAPCPPEMEGDDCRKWRRRADARPGEIAEAALALFVEKGFAATRVDEIAQRAGVTKGTVYLYYENKEALFRAAVTETLVPLLEEGERTVAEWTGSSAALLDHAVHRWWKVVRDGRVSCVPKLMTAEAGNFPELAEFYMRAVIHRARGIFAAILRRGIDRGEFRPVDVPTATRLVLSAMMNAVIYRHSLLRFDDQPFDFDEYFRLHVELVLRGLSTGDPDGKTIHA